MNAINKAPPRMEEASPEVPPGTNGHNFHVLFPATNNNLLSYPLLDMCDWEELGSLLEETPLSNSAATAASVLNLGCAEEPAEEPLNAEWPSELEPLEVTHLPDSAATAAAALKAEWADELLAEPPEELLEYRLTTSDQKQGGPDNICPVFDLTDRLGRMSSGETTIVSLGETFRISSKDWDPVHLPMFEESEREAWSKKNDPLMSPVIPKPLIVDNVPTPTKKPSPASVASKTNTTSPSSQPSWITPKKKTRRPRELDACVIEPTDDDVKFGRGGGTNNHPGNRRFRNYARHLWPAYKHATKTEKQDLASMLVESVENEGHRFVEEGKDGLWHEVIFGQHTKASATLRDVPKYFNVD